MANLQITDEFGLNATVQLQDGSPLAKAKITHLAGVGPSLKDQIDKPLDQTSLKGFSFGVDCSAPGLTLGDVVKISANAGACGTVSIIKPTAQALFANDDFTPIPIASDECWVAVELNESIDVGAQATVDGFGAHVTGAAALDLTTYTRIQASAGKFPAVIDGLTTALNGFYLTFNSNALRAQPIGTVCVNELSGSVTFTGSYQLPVSINALASADLPFNYKIEVQPKETLNLSGCIALSGDLIVRSHKTAAQSLDIGVYKKKGSTLTATFNAAAGIGIDEGTTDLASLVLSKAIAGATAKNAGITGGNAAGVNSALNQCIDRSLSFSVNGNCSAALTDEAAVVYSVDLSAGNTDETNAALKSALQGDWTPLSQLRNAKLIRNIVTDSKEHKHTMTINLFGVYNATAIDDYTQSCTILHDGNGQLSVIDKANENRISAAATPYASDPDKLRNALAQDFLSTASYAVIASKVQPALTIQQSYFLYNDALPAQKMRDQIRIGSALKLIDDGPAMQFWNATLAANAKFPHAQISVSAKYNNAAVLGLFFGNSSARQPRSRAEIERAGRNAMVALIDPDEPSSSSRLSALQNDDVWNAMNASGAVSAFASIPQLNQLPAPTLGDIGADWTAIAWWADAMAKIMPEFSELLAFLETLPAADFSDDPEFTAKNRKFQNLLESLAKNTHAALVPGWDMAVVFTLAGTGTTRSMDIVWTGNARHYQNNNG